MAAQVQVQPQAAVPVVPQATGGASPLPTTSLYIGDLDASVVDDQLFDIFSQVGQVVSVRVCRDATSRRSLGYAYVNYGNPADAAKAMDMLNFTPLNGKTIRIMYSNRDPSSRKSGAANIFIKNLEKSIDHKALHDTFSVFGNIVSCKVATEPSGESKGYGFVQFDSEEAAQSAIEALNNKIVNGKQVYVGPFIRKNERDNSVGSSKFNNVFVKNLSENTTEDKLNEFFGQYGEISSSVIMRDGDGKSKCFGFVNFSNPDAAAKAVEELNGKRFDDKEWYVGKAQKKAEREMELKAKFEQSTREVLEKPQVTNLYLKNLDDSVGDNELKDLFSKYGTITSSKVMCDQSGISKGSGFVAFASPESASRALAEMNGKMIGSKPLYVALAQRKEERKARLQAQFSQMRPVTMPPVASRVPLYPPGAPGMGQPLFYGQPPHALIPQPGFGFQQPHLHGMRPGTGPVPNFFMPMVQQGQQAQRPGVRRAGAGPMHGTHHQVPVHQQMLPRGGRTYRHPPGRIMPDVMGNVAGGMLSGPYDGAMPLSKTLPIGTLASALMNATPEEQRTMLGENLYPLVDRLEHDHAAKVTGMLLEMDQTEVLHLLESPEALKAKVVEALEVLRNVGRPGDSPTDQLAALSLNDGVVS